jgi:hypothetical protein
VPLGGGGEEAVRVALRVRDPERGRADEQYQRKERADAAERRQQDPSEPAALVGRRRRWSSGGALSFLSVSFRERRRDASAVGSTVAERQRGAYPE